MILKKGYKVFISFNGEQSGYWITEMNGFSGCILTIKDYNEMAIAVDECKYSFMLDWVYPVLEVGKKYRVIKPEDINEYSRWVPEMDKYDGKIVTIDYCEKKLVRIVNDGWHFSSKWFEEIEEKSAVVFRHKCFLCGFPGEDLCICFYCSNPKCRNFHK